MCRRQRYKTTVTSIFSVSPFYTLLHCIHIHVSLFTHFIIELMNIRISPHVLCVEGTDVRHASGSYVTSSAVAIASHCLAGFCCLLRREMYIEYMVDKVQVGGERLER